MEDIRLAEEDEEVATAAAKELTEKQQARLVQRALGGDEVYKYDSSRGEKDKYDVIIAGDTGKVGCNCPGWTRHKGTLSRPRECGHVRHRMAVQRIDKVRFEPRAVGDDAYWYKVREGHDGEI